MARTIVIKKATRKAPGKTVASRIAKVKSTARKPSERAAAQVVATALPVAMTGRASPAKAKDGDEPVFAYIRSLPQPQRGIAERVDALAAKTLPALKRSVKWGMAWYGVGDGWCFCCGGFAGHVKLTFGRGTSLKPVATGYAGRNGQGLAWRGPRIDRRYRRTPSRVVDETSHGHPGLREEAISRGARAGKIRSLSGHVIANCGNGLCCTLGGLNSQSTRSACHHALFQASIGVSATQSA